MHDGIKPQPEKVSAIPAINPSRPVKKLCRFLGMLQYYWDLWEKRCRLTALLTELVGDCVTPKVQTRKGLRKDPSTVMTNTRKPSAASKIS